MVQLQRGREPSMYTDQSEDGSVRIPAMVVREAAARDCVVLAQDCLHSARVHLTQAPAQRSRAEDQVFALKSVQVSDLMNNEDFWWYYISIMEAGKNNFADAVVSYRNSYLLAGKTFRQSPPVDADGGA
jgi:Sec7-like guanine-nucleotide exchange factor